MNLSAFRVANFKAFAAAQRVPLRPITLVYGPNSAGKSSILHALALSHHATETGDLDTQGTQIGGESIDLGGFRQYVHRHERDRPVQLDFELEPAGLSGRVAASLRSARRVVVGLSIGEAIRTSQESLFGTDPREFDSNTEVRLERFSLEVDDVPLLSMSTRPGGLLRLDSLDHTHPVFRELFRGLLTLATTTEEIQAEDFVALGEVLDALVPTVTAKQRGLFPRVEEEAEGSETERQSWEALVPVSRGRRGEDLARAARLFFPRALRELVDGLGMAVEDDIRRLRYLGPLRSYPPRHLAFAQHHDPNWFAGGGHTWDVVRTREDVRQRVNAWLGDADRLKTPYELRVRELLPGDALPDELASKLRETLQDLVLTEAEGQDRSSHLWSVLDAVRDAVEGGVKEESYSRADVEHLVDELMDIEGVTNEWVQEIVDTRGEALQDLVLIDKRSGTPVSHRDVGIGVSQVLPVLVSAYAWRDSLLAIEQPEIHIHPALQAELGDVFIESALGDRGNTFLIETHSEHLLLRILRRIRETHDGELPEDSPAVRPEQVTVLYVQPGRDGTQIIDIPLTSDGEFECPWPEGFFAERAKELF